MARKRRLSLAEQVEKIQNDRTYLRSGLEVLVALARDVPHAISPAIVKQVEAMLDYTKDYEDGE